MDERNAIAALVSDLHWQVAQLKSRGIKDAAGNPYNPSYYKRGLKNAIDQGGLVVADYVRGYLYKPPSGGYRKLEEKESLDLVCEALVAAEDKPYAHLFTQEDRAAARKRLAPHIAAIEARKAAQESRVEALGDALPDDVTELRDRGAQAADPEVAIAVNTAILRHVPDDVVALNRLGRAYASIERFDQASQTFERVIAVDPNNRIASRWLKELDRKLRR